SILTPLSFPLFFYFFFNDTATPEIYTLSLHDALPICGRLPRFLRMVVSWRRVPEAQLAESDLVARLRAGEPTALGELYTRFAARSEEHTSELQSLAYLVCRLLLEKKKN